VNPPILSEEPRDQVKMVVLVVLLTRSGGRMCTQDLFSARPGQVAQVVNGQDRDIVLLMVNQRRRTVCEAAPVPYS
jgi:hypothetical protein